MRIVECYWSITSRDRGRAGIGVNANQRGSRREGWDGNCYRGNYGDNQRGSRHEGWDGDCYRGNYGDRGSHKGKNGSNQRCSHSRSH